MFKELAPDALADMLDLTASQYLGDQIGIADGRTMGNTCCSSCSGCTTHC